MEPLSQGRLLYLVLLLLVVLFFASRSGLPTSGALRLLAIWGAIIAGIALVYALVVGGF